MSSLNDESLVALAKFVAARSSVNPYPGWVLGSGESDKNLLVRLRQALWVRARTPFELKWLAGARLWAFPGDETMRSVFVTGRYEPNLFAVLNRFLRPGMTFVDAGANIGLYSIFAAKKVGGEGTVLSIEPSSREFSKLQSNIELNKPSCIRPLQVGLWHCRGNKELLVAGGERAGHNTLGAFGYDTPLFKREEIHLEPLDAIVEREGVRRVDVIKMDIEGAELFALQGAGSTLSKYRPMLLLEFSDTTLKHQGCNVAQIWDLLSAAGYRIYAFDDRSGLPVQAEKKPYYDSENIAAIHESA